MKKLEKRNFFMEEVIFKDFTTFEHNFFIALCYKMYNQEANEIVLSFKEIKELANYRLETTSLFILELFILGEKMVRNTTTVEIDDNCIISFALFPMLDINRKEQTLTVRATPKHRFFLEELVSQFTEIDLKCFILLNSKYSKTLYRKLTQFKESGFYKVKAEELTLIMDVPESYSSKKILRDIINPAVDELSNYFSNLKIEIEYENTHETAIFSFVFKFDKKELLLNTNEIPIVH